MAIYHCTVKTVSRSAGQSSVASAAYRAGEKLLDRRTGEEHDYTKKRGVLHQEIVSPHGVKFIRSELWNNAEQSENRKNSTVAREYEVALPSELNFEQQKTLVQNFSAHLVSTYGVCADVAIHAPNKKGDERNFHAHILTTTRAVTAEGFGSKTRVLDDKKTGEIERIREKWAESVNNALGLAGHDITVSHKSLKKQGFMRKPTQHVGVSATAMQRRGLETDRQRAPAENPREERIREEIALIEDVSVSIKNIKEEAKQWREKERREREQKERELRIQKQYEQKKLEEERKINAIPNNRRGMSL